MQQLRLFYQEARNGRSRRGAADGRSKSIYAPRAEGQGTRRIGHATDPIRAAPPVAVRMDPHDVAPALDQQGRQQRVASLRAIIVPGDELPLRPVKFQLGIEPLGRALQAHDLTRRPGPRPSGVSQV